MITCNICLWNESLWEFDDMTYASPFRLFYQHFVYTGYNHVINPNNYNPCFVCNDCFLVKIYCCDFDSFEKCLK